MKLSTTIFAVIILATVIGGSTVFAETRESQTGERVQQGGGLPRPPRPLPGSLASTTMRGDHRIGSSTDIRTERMGSSTDMKPDGRRGVPGVITALTDKGFTMSGRGLGADHASTTFTVLVTSSTKYQHGMGTSTLAALTVGTKVEVLGVVATSTRSITADRIMFGMGDMRNEGEHGKSDQAPGQLKKQGFFERLRNFFGGRATTGTTTNAGGPAAADASGDILGTIMSAFFGWLR